MAGRKKIKSSLLLFIILFLWLVFVGKFVMGWASPITSGEIKPKKVVNQRFNGIFSEDNDNNIKANEDYDGFDNFYRQHEDIPSPGVGN